VRSCAPAVTGIGAPGRHELGRRKPSRQGERS
jgi:hypothetical protein